MNATADRLHALATEEHAAQAILRFGVALQRGLLEIVECLVQVLRGVLAVVIELTQLVLRLCIPFIPPRLAAPMVEP